MQSLSCVSLYATPWTAACQASLSFTITWSLLRLMSTELMMPSNYPILCQSLLFLPSVLSQHQGLSWVLIISCAFSGARITSFMVGPPDRHTWMLKWGWTLHLQNTLNSLWFRLQSYLFPNLSPSSYFWPVTLARLSGLTLRQNEVPVWRSTYLILLELTRL